MFSGLACSSRWTKAYYKRNHVAFQEFQNSELLDSGSVTITTTPCRRRVRILSGQDQYRRTHDLCQKLSSVIAEKSMREFTYHIKNLEQLLDLLSQSKHYAITEVFSCDYEEVLQPQNSPQKETDIFHTNADVQEIRVPGEQPVDIIEHTLPMDDSAATGGETGPTPEADILNGNPEFFPAALTILETETRPEPDIVIESVESLPAILSEVQAETQPGQANSTDDDIPLRLPPKMQIRGRPKGAEVTVLGLPRKRTSRRIPFLKRAPKVKEQAMLSWIVPGEMVKTAMESQRKIDIESIRTVDLSYKLLDENVNIQRIRKYFEKDSWDFLKKSIGLTKR